MLFVFIVCPTGHPYTTGYDPPGVVAIHWHREDAPARQRLHREVFGRSDVYLWRALSTDRLRHGLRTDESKRDGERNVLIYDLGGGTLTSFFDDRGWHLRCEGGRR